MLRSNLTEYDPAKLWLYPFQITEVEKAFKELKVTSPSSDVSS